jgi:hypothetical protein
MEGLLFLGRPMELGELLPRIGLRCPLCVALLAAMLSGDILLPKLSTLPDDECTIRLGFNSTEFDAGEGVRSLNTMAVSES